MANERPSTFSKGFTGVREHQVVERSGNPVALFDLLRPQFLKIFKDKDLLLSSLGGSGWTALDPADPIRSWAMRVVSVASLSKDMARVVASDKRRMQGYLRQFHFTRLAMPTQWHNGIKVNPRAVAFRN